MSRKSKKMSEVMNYKDKIYLLFFKCNAQENALMKSLENKDVAAIEQNSNAMAKYAKEGMAALDTINAYDGDATLKNSCKHALQFFLSEADKTTDITSYLIKSEAFEQIKKSFESNPNAQKDKEEVKKFNQAVDDLNKGVKDYNQTNQKLNETRHSVYEEWNGAEKDFLDNHVPYVN